MMKLECNRKRGAWEEGGDSPRPKTDDSSSFERTTRVGSSRTARIRTGTGSSSGDTWSSSVWGSRWKQFCVAWSQVRLQQSSGESCFFSTGQAFFLSQSDPQGQSVTETPCRVPNARRRTSAAAFMRTIILDLMRPIKRPQGASSNVVADGFAEPAASGSIESASVTRLYPDAPSQIPSFASWIA